MTRRKRDEGGSVPLEVALVAPAILGLLMLVMFSARVTRSKAEVQNAAAAAARAATLTSNEPDALEAAQEVAEDNLDNADITCDPVVISLGSGTDLTPGGQVVVSITCTATVSDLALVALPGAYDFTATSTEVIDTFRGGS